MRMFCVVVMGLLVMPGVTRGAVLRMQWRTLGPDDREQATIPGELLVLDIYFQMNAGDSLSAMSFSNEYAPSVSQVGTSANNGWLDESTDDVLGGVNQLVSFSGPTLVGPGEFLIGSHTIRLDDVGDGSTKAIMFRLEPDLRDSAGNPYSFSPFPTNTIGFYSIGAGFPDTIFCDPTSCPPDPLIVNIVHPIPDCNGNFVNDAIDVTSGTSIDSNGNGWPDECEANVLFVDEHASGSKYGTSWADAYTDLRQAFDVAHGTGFPVTEVWVAAGTYSPGTSRVATFRLKSELAVYGGFIGGETERDQRDPLTNATILTGDVARDDGPGFANNDENNFHVVIANEIDPTAVLDGLIITAGHANGLDYPFDRGGGLFILLGSPSLANCGFVRNVALHGGGVYSAWSWNWPFSQSAASILNCSFLGNVADDGAGLYNRTSATTLINNVFSGNSADNRGGAMYNWPGSHTTITNCTFGGNVAASEGGAMYTWGNTIPNITNCIFWQNTPQSVVDFGNTTITNSDIEGGWPGIGNIDSDPLFVDWDGEDDIVGTSDDDLRPQLGSPVIDAGDNLALPSSVATDIIGNDRFLDGDANGSVIVDMGAYEILDCNGNGNSDDDDVTSGSSFDCNGNGIPDECDDDCNGNLLADSCDIADGTSDDLDQNGVPDECQVILHVPSVEYPTIQSAIDSAANGDTVLVADGTYKGAGNKNLNLNGKNLTVRSESGPNRCIIDCELDGQGFTFENGETSFTIIDGFTITNARHSGGGLAFANGSSPTILNCIIKGSRNTHSFGGAMYCYGDGAPTFENCAFLNNTATLGGAIYYGSCSPVFVNCVFSGNKAAVGGAMYTVNSGTVTIINSILWGDVPDEIDGNGTVTISYSNIQGGWPGTANIDADPGFAFPDDLHLLPGSPCIDAGFNDPPAGLPTTDADRNDRLLDGDDDAIATVDMGPYEFDAQTAAIAITPTYVEFFAPIGGPPPSAERIRVRNRSGGLLDWTVQNDCPWLGVTPSVGQSTGEIDEIVLMATVGNLSYGAYDCTITISDDQAINDPQPVALRLHVNTTLYVPADFSTIQPAIDAAIVDGDTVVVADGTYTGDQNNYLWFSGKRITLRSENGPENCIIFAGDRGRGFDFHGGETERTVVDGFTITNANNVAGIWMTQASDPTIRNCIITQNISEGIRASDSNPTIVNCQITDNGDDGIHLQSSSARINNCLISGNRNGGLLVESGSPTIANCRITLNSIDWIGGGVRFAGRGSPTMVNSVIAWNNSERVAGAVWCGSDSACRIINCTVDRNEDNGIAASHEDAVITNCIVTGNQPGQIDDRAKDVVSVTYSNIGGGWPGVGNLSDSPRFVDSLDGDFRLKIDSTSIDAGDNTAVPQDVNDLDNDGNTEEPVPLDGGGQHRFVDIASAPDTGQGTQPIVDIGAHERSNCDDDELPAEWELIDCNDNNIADTCDIEDMASSDCNADGVPDECHLAANDCNANAVLDECDVAAGAPDCNFNETPDECEPDEDCNTNGVRDICDIGAFTALDCNGNSVPDSCDLSAGFSPDTNGNNVPDECDVVAPLIPDSPHDWPKNRFISFSPLITDGVPVAYRVELLDRLCVDSGKKCTTDSDCTVCDSGSEAGVVCAHRSECPGANCAVSGEACVDNSAPVAIGWVGDPVEVPEDSNARIPPGLFTSLVVKDQPNARLWPEEVVHVGDCEIAPAQSYALSASGLGILSDPLLIGTVPKPQGKFWGDIVGSFNGVEWSAPNGLVGVDDVTAMIKFLTLKPAPHITVIDLVGGAPSYVNFNVNATDLQMVLEAFVAKTWPPLAVTRLGYPADGDVTQCP